MKHPLSTILLATVAVLFVAGCAAQMEKITAFNTQAQADIVAAQPIVNGAACDAQKAANAAEDAATVLGNTKAAADADLVSKATGALCLTLAKS